MTFFNVSDYLLIQKVNNLVIKRMLYINQIYIDIFQKNDIIIKSNPKSLGQHSIFFQRGSENHPFSLG